MRNCRIKRARVRAQRQPHGDLPLADRGARQQQVREVGAGDEQDEADRAEQHEQRPPHVPTSASRSGATSSAVPWLIDCSAMIAFRDRVQIAPTPARA